MDGGKLMRGENRKWLACGGHNSGASALHGADRGNLAELSRSEGTEAVRDPACLLVLALHPQAIRSTAAAAAAEASRRNRAQCQPTPTPHDRS